MAASNVGKCVQVNSESGDMTIYQGSCACGAIRYQADALPSRPQHCQCGLCRHAVGASVVLRVDFPEAEFRWLGSRPVFYSGPGNSRHGFCANCGSALCTQAGDGFVSVYVQTLDGDAPVAPRSHVHTCYDGWLSTMAAAS